MYFISCLILFCSSYYITLLRLKYLHKLSNFQCCQKLFQIYQCLLYVTIQIYLVTSYSELKMIRILIRSPLLMSIYPFQKNNQYDKPVNAIMKPLDDELGWDRVKKIFSVEYVSYYINYKSYYSNCKISFCFTCIHKTYIFV